MVVLALPVLWWVEEHAWCLSSDSTWGHVWHQQPSEVARLRVPGSGKLVSLPSPAQAGGGQPSARREPGMRCRQGCSLIQSAAVPRRCRERFPGALRSVGVAGIPWLPLELSGS